MDEYNHSMETYLYFCKTMRLTVRLVPFTIRVKVVNDSLVSVPRFTLQPPPPSEEMCTVYECSAYLTVAYRLERVLHIARCPSMCLSDRARGTKTSGHRLRLVPHHIDKTKSLFIACLC